MHNTQNCRPTTHVVTEISSGIVVPSIPSQFIVTPLTIYLCFLAPTAPRSFNVHNSTDNTVSLSWMTPDPANGIITNYQLEYRSTPNSPFITLVNSTELTYRVTGLSPQTGYEFRVAAYTRVGMGPYTNTIQATTTSKLYCILSAKVFTF